MQKMPEGELQEIVQSLTWWLQAVSKCIDRHETILLDLCRRVLKLPLKYGTGILRDGEPINEPVSEAINHSVGNVTQVLLNLWFKREPNDNDKLPTNIEPFFTDLCDPTVEQFRHGRVLLASRLIALFRVDRPWTETHLLPLFDWTTHPAEARAAWEGFLWSPRLYRPLLIAFKTQFLETAQHYAELSEHSGQFATFLIYAALDPVEGYSARDFQTAIGALPQKGLHEAAQALSQALEGAGEQRENYWGSRVQPLWHQIWPKSRDLATNGIAESLSRLSIAAGAEFPSALTAVWNWLCPIEHPHYILQRLNESGLCGRFPDEALRLLGAIIDSQPWISRELEQCLKEISQALPELERDHRYQRLMEHARRLSS